MQLQLTVIISYSQSLAHLVLTHCRYFISQTQLPLQETVLVLVVLATTSQCSKYNSNINPLTVAVDLPAVRITLLSWDKQDTQSLKGSYILSIIYVELLYKIIISHPVYLCLCVPSYDLFSDAINNALPMYHNTIATL